MQRMPVFFSILPCELKSCVTEIRSNPAKRNLFRPRSGILPDLRVVGYRPGLSCDGFEFRRNKEFVRPEAKLLRLAGEVARRVSKNSEICRSISAGKHETVFPH